jgi:hypothetical protein
MLQTFEGARMTRANIEGLTTAELVARFSDLALEQHEAVETFRTARYNRLYDRIKLIERQLKAREGDQRRALIPLLDAPNIQVRYMAAYALLTIVPEQVQQALLRIRQSGHFPQSADASYTLDHFGDSIAQFLRFEAEGQ